MRDLKFRAWDGKGWTTLGMFQGIENGMKIFGISQHEGIILMQYTGKNDKNNKGIYEGDILSVHPHGANYPTKWVVQYSEQRLVFEVSFLGYDGINSTAQSFPTNATIEIVGNIYENPELLNRNTKRTSERGK